MRTVALDLGATTISYSEARDGKIIERTTARNLSSLADRLGPNTGRARVAFEACREAWLVHDRLLAAGHEPLMLDTTRIQQIGVGQHKRKNDRIDADAMALAVDRGSVALAHVLSSHRRDLRYQITIRRALVEARAHFVALIRETVRARGHRIPTCKVEDFVRKLKLAKLDEATRLLVSPMQVAVESLDTQIAIVDAKLEQLCQQEPVINLLMTAPGVGPIVAASFVSVIDEARRFRHAHQVEAYIGLVPSEDTTGGPRGRRIGAITKQGNRYLRSMLVQAAWSILRLKDNNDPLKRWGDALVERRGKQIAVVALARRLAGVLWAMWRRDSTYDPGRLATAAAVPIGQSPNQTASRAALLERAAKKFQRRLSAKKGNRINKH